MGKTDEVKSAGRNSNLLKISCQICGRNFGIRSIKIHELQCLKKHRSEIDTSINDQNNKTSLISTSPNGVSYDVINYLIIDIYIIKLNNE